MAKPAHIQQDIGYISPHGRNDDMLRALVRILDEHIDAEMYGTITLTVRVQRGSLQRDITVSQEREHRLA